MSRLFIKMSTFIMNVVVTFSMNRSNKGCTGIKSIRNELRLEFYKKTVNKSFDPSNHRIKAIYGENGCGKTAVVSAGADIEGSGI